MAVDSVDGRGVGNANMVGRDAHHRPQLLVNLVNQLVSFSSSAGGEQPKVAELCAKRRRDASQGSKGDQVGEQVVGDHSSQHRGWRPGRDEHV